MGANPEVWNKPLADYTVKSHATTDGHTVQLVTLGQGAATVSTPANVSVGVSSTSVLAAEATRLRFVLTNLSTGAVFFGIGATAVLNKGICLAQYGVWEETDPDIAKLAINGIVAASTSTVAIQEFRV